VTDWDSADDRSNREKIIRARRAAEDLFKRAQQTSSPEFTAPASSTSSTGQRARRQPRVLTIAPPTVPSAKTEMPADQKQKRREKAPGQHTGIVPSSQTGRVRALTTYGMSRTQVARLYGVTTKEIDRIIKGPAYPTKTR
jgi:hypothetical protein